MKNDLLKLGKLLDQERQLELKIRALKEKQKSLNGPKWQCIEWSENGFVLHVSLAQLMEASPMTDPSWHTFETNEGGEKGYFRYGPVCLGEVRKGHWLWIKHETQSVVTKEPPAKIEAIEPAKESGVAA